MDAFTNDAAKRIAAILALGLESQSAEGPSDAEADQIVDWAYEDGVGEGWEAAISLISGVCGVEFELLLDLCGEVAELVDQRPVPVAELQSAMHSLQTVLIYGMSTEPSNAIH